MADPVVERLAEITWQVVDGEYDALRRIVEAAGGRWSYSPSTGPVAHTASGMTVGIPVHGDPVGCFVQVAFAVAGQRWTELPEFMAAMRAVQEEWSARTKAARLAKAAVS